MPRYYRKRQYRRKRSYKPRYKRNRRFRSRFSKQTRMVSRNIVAPDVAFTKLKVTDTVFLSGLGNLPHSTGTLATDFTNRRLIRGNDIFDPLSSAGSVTATGLQQWCSQTGLYNQFLVHGSKIKIEIANLDATETTAMVCSLYPIMESNATLQPVGSDQPYVRTSFVGASTGSSKCVLKNFMKTKKMLGCKDLVDDELNYGQYNASPNLANIWDWALDVQTLGSSASSQAIAIRKEVTYYVQFLQRPVIVVPSQP